MKNTTFVLRLLITFFFANIAKPQFVIATNMYDASFQHSLGKPFSNPQTHDLILTGQILCMTCSMSVDNIAITLTDLETKAIQSYKTDIDGTYYFLIESDKKYWLTAEIEDVEGVHISTIGKHEEVLHSVLKVHKSHCNKCIGKFHIIPSPPIPEDVPWNNDASEMPKLTYRIQLSSFKEARSPKSDFRLKAGYKVLEEQASNGFYRYLTEHFYSFEKTKEKLEILKNKGYDKAWIVPYYDGKRLRISPEKAKEKYGN